MHYKKPGARRPHGATFTLHPVAGCVMAALAQIAAANPTGHQIAAGSASVQSAGKTLTITNTPGTILNWQSFSIAPGELTKFVQQSSASAVLNRVVAANPSSILGTLSSNGRVFLVNPHGIVIGAGALIDTAGFVASTLNIADKDFLAGKMKFEGGGAGVLRNEGTIQAARDIFLVGPKIENTGIIRSESGDVVLAAGKSVTITSPDAHGVQFGIQAPEDSVVNLGTIQASNAVGLFAGTLKHSGEIKVTRASLDSAGRVVLSAQKDAFVDGSATISVDNSVGKGGQVQVLGERVGLFDRATITATGAAGGGEILIGGDYRGLNPGVRNATATFIGEGAHLRADATTAGDGGRVIVWSDDATRVHGSISALGVGSGKGGFVETSGGYLEVTRSPAIGAGGTWLLDPRNFEVVSTATTNNSGPPSFTATGDDSQIINTQINAQLDAGTNVVLDTNTGGGTQAGNITVSAPITKTNANAASLTLNAQNDVTINAAVNLTPGGDVNVTTANVSSTMTVNRVVTSGGATSLNLAGALVVQSSAGQDAQLVSGNGQTITARSVLVSAQGGTLAAIDTNAGNQSVTVNGGGASFGIDVLNLNAAGNQARIQNFGTGTQTIAVNDADRIRVRTQSASGPALITAQGNQTVTIQGSGQNAIEIGNAGALGPTRIRSNAGSQSVTAGTGGQAGSITLIGGAADGGQNAYLGILGGSGTHTVSTTGNITITGGTSPGTAGSDTCLDRGSCGMISQSATGPQTITAANIVINGGSGGTNNPGRIGATFGDQQINVGGMTMLGGTGTGNSAQLLGTVNQNITVGAAGITLTAGAGNSATINQNDAGGTQSFTINGGGSVALQGGSGSDTQNQAQISAAGTAQTLNFTAGGNLQLTGGTNGTLSIARIRTTAAGSTQTISGAAGITLTGGASGGGFVTGPYATRGNFAQIRAEGDQSISVGAGGITMTGGGGTLSDNFASIFQADTGAPRQQTITVGGGGTINLTGGSSSGAAAPGENSGSLSFIRADGGAGQTIAFTAGGAINVTGGTNGTGNNAGFRARFGQQTISGSPTITMIGGASGGIDGDANTANIFADVGTQTITAGTTSLSGGSGGIANSAVIRARTQDITVNGNLTLSGTTGTGTGGARIGSLTDQAMDLNLTVGGDLTQNGGSVTNAGSAIGASNDNTSAQVTNITINTTGNVTLNGGAANGSRIGHPTDLVAGGAISVVAGGNIAFVDSGTTSGNIRTTGNVTLRADSVGRSITQASNSTILANTLTASAHSGITLNGSNTVTSFNASNTTANGVQFTQSAGSLLTLTGMGQVGGNATITADDLNVTGAVNAGTGTVTLRPTTLARNVNIETTPTAGTLSLSPAELNFVTAGQLDLGRLDGTGALSVAAPLTNTEIHATTLRLLGGGDISILAPIDRSTGGNIDMTTASPGSLVTITRDVTAGDAMNLNLAGNLLVTSSAGQNAQLISKTGQSITARSISVIANGGTNATIQNDNTGTQTITVNGAGAGGIEVINNSTGLARILNFGSGLQSITINNGDFLTVDGRGGSADIAASAGSQTILLQGTAGPILDLNLGSAAAVGSSLITTVGNQSITVGTVGQVGEITMLGGVTNNTQAGIFKTGATGTQTISTTGILTMTGGAMAPGGVTGADAEIRHAGNGVQSISANSIVLQGGPGTGGFNDARITNTNNASSQQITVGAGGMSLTAGGTGSQNVADISQNGTGGSQTITVSGGGSIILQGGSSSSGTAQARIIAAGPSQTINFAAGGNLQLTGGTNGTLNTAAIQTTGGAASAQTISGATGITLTGGANGGGVDAGNNSLGNFARIRSDFGTQSISVGSGGITMTAGSGPLTNNFVEISQGLNGTALVAGTTQTITINNGGTLALTGGSSAQTNVINNAGGFFRGSFASIQSNGVTQQFDFPNGGAINLTGGTVGSNNVAQLQLRFGSNQNITGAPNISVTGGASGGVQNGTQNEGNRARITANVGNQNIAAGTLSLTGGGAGMLNSARIDTQAVGSSQTITASGITITGGAGGGGFVTTPSFSTRGNLAQISGAGDQTVTVGAAGIVMTGGGGALSDNFASLFQSDAGALRQQTITVGGGGTISLTGGSSSGVAAPGDDGSGSFSFIRADGGAGQTIAFTAGGAINVTGGTNGAGNNAGFRARLGPQTISGSPTITMIGGASGGVAGDANNTTIFADVGTQTITAGTASLSGGSGGIGNNSLIRARTQNITVNGNLTLNGPSGTGTGGSRIGSLTNQAMDLTLNVGGNLTLNGGSSTSGAVIGASGDNTTPQTTNITITAGGDVLLNGGTGGGSRIGHPADLIAGGAISVVAGGNIAFVDSGTTSGNMRTTGNVTLNANGAGATITQGPSSVIAANTLNATAAGGVSLAGANEVANLIVTSGGDFTLITNQPQNITDLTVNTPAGTQTVTLTSTNASADITVSDDLMSDDNYIVTSGRNIVFSGATTIGANSITVAGPGTLQFPSGAVTSINAAVTSNMPVVVSGGTVSFNGTTTANNGVTISSGTLQGTGNVTVNGGTLAWSGGTVAGPATLTTTGTTIINGMVTLDTRTWNNALAVGQTGASRVTLANGATINNQMGATWTASGTEALAIVGAGSFNNAGSFVNSGTTAHTLAVPYTNTGTTLVSEGGLTLPDFPANAGTLNVLGGTTLSTSGAPIMNTGLVTGGGTIITPVFSNNGTVSPGASPGMLTINGDYTQLTNGVLAIDIEGTQAGVTYDLLRVTGTANLGGTLLVRHGAGYFPGSGENSEFMTYASRTGDFTNFVFPPGFAYTAQPGTTGYGVVAPMLNVAQQAASVATNDVLALKEEETTSSEVVEQMKEDEDKNKQKGAVCS